MSSRSLPLHASTVGNSSFDPRRLRICADSIAKPLRTSERVKVPALKLPGSIPAGGHHVVPQQTAGFKKPVEQRHASGSQREVFPESVEVPLSTHGGESPSVTLTPTSSPPSVSMDHSNSVEDVESIVRSWKLAIGSQSTEATDLSAWCNELSLRHQGVCEENARLRVENCNLRAAQAALQSEVEELQTSLRQAREEVPGAAALLNEAVECVDYRAAEAMQRLAEAEERAERAEVALQAIQAECENAEELSCKLAEAELRARKAEAALQAAEKRQQEENTWYLENEMFKRQHRDGDRAEVRFEITQGGRHEVRDQTYRTLWEDDSLNRTLKADGKSFDVSIKEHVGPALEEFEVRFHEASHHCSHAAGCLQAVPPNEVMPSLQEKVMALHGAVAHKAEVLESLISRLKLSDQAHIKATASLFKANSKLQGLGHAIRPHSPVISKIS